MDLNEMLSSDDPNWVEALPAYQREIVHELLGQGLSAEEAASKWLNSTGPSNTFPFGAGPGQSVFYEKLVEEVEAFLCGSERYAEDRKRFFAEFQAKHAYIVGGISVSVAPALGAAAPLLAPAIALTLLTIGRITLNAWCASRKAPKA